MEKVNYRTPEWLAENTNKNARENSRLIKALKKVRPEALDAMVHKLHKRAFARFDCLDCANCCKTIGPRLIPADIERLAKYLKMKVSVFSHKYIREDEDHELVFSSSPCPFLMPGNECMVYEQRPKACREYPHTDRKRFHQILDLTLKNCETCPVVYDIIGELNKNPSV